MERKRLGIEKVNTEIGCGRFPIKRVIGEKVIVQTDILAAWPRRGRDQSLI